MNTETHLLIDTYKDVESISGIPDGMHQVSPTIPFIGKKSSEMKNRILVYASAENLTYLNSPEEHTIFQLLKADVMNRHRFFYEDSDKSGAFPYIHLRPMEDGSLMTVARIIAGKLDYDKYSHDPYGFVEEICVGNFGKFAVSGGVNSDYANNFSKLKHSIAYVIADMSVLKPKVVIIPKTIFNTIEKKFGWAKLKKDAGILHPIEFIRIFQVNQQVINTHIRKKLSSNSEEIVLSEVEKNWMAFMNKKLKNFVMYAKWIHLNFDSIRMIV